MKRTMALGLMGLIILTSCSFRATLDPEERYKQAQSKLKSAGSKQMRFYALRDAAKAGVELKKYEESRKLAEELLSVAPKYDKDWNYGNAIHDSHVVLGRVLLAEGKLEEAKSHLLAAGKTPGSPQLDSFGPNMTLARDLLKSGENDAVIQYLDSCRNFWKNDFGAIEKWKKQIHEGRMPDFGANLLY